MRNALFTESQFEQMGTEVAQVLAEVGYAVDHPRVRAMAGKAGCRESPQGRLLFSAEQIDCLRRRLLAQYPPVDLDAGVGIVHPRREFRAHLGNLTPKYFNYASGKAEGGDARNFADLMRFAQMDPRVTGVGIPVSRQDIPPQTEQLESILAMATMTDKSLGSADPLIPETVPYLAAMGEVLGLAPTAFVGQCNCINPPLRLEHRTAETMLRRSRYHATSMITPMPSIGGSGPVDIHGCVILATAEIVGGLILSMIIDPEAPLLGYIACNQVDMLTANGTSSTPQTIRVDAGVYQLMEACFGGGTRVGGRSYISARRPGMQAVFERFLKAVGYSSLVDRHAIGLGGAGNLDNGSMVSPEQFLLDLEMGEGLDWVWTQPLVPPPGDAAARIRKTVLHAGGDFLSSDHTLASFRKEMWPSRYFQALTDTRTERQILDRCHAEFRAVVASYVPASHSDSVLRSLRGIVKAAREELL